MEEPAGPVARECVEGYLFSYPPLRVLVFRRPPSRGRIWVPISGKVDPGDVDLEHALRRELLEETGLVRPRRVVPLDWHVRFRADNGEVWRLHAFGVEVVPGFAPRLSDEHEESRWLDFAEARPLLHFEDNRVALDRLASRVAPSGATNV